MDNLAYSQPLTANSQLRDSYAKTSKALTNQYQLVTGEKEHDYESVLKQSYIIHRCRVLLQRLFSATPIFLGEINDYFNHIKAEQLRSFERLAVEHGERDLKHAYEILSKGNTKTILLPERNVTDNFDEMKAIMSGFNHNYTAYKIFKDKGNAEVAEGYFAACIDIIKDLRLKEPVIERFLAKVTKLKDKGVETSDEKVWGLNTAQLKRRINALTRISRIRDEAISVITKSNLRLVNKRCHKLSSVQNENFMDMQQSGMIGLIYAAKSFDFFLGNRFSTHAVYWIECFLKTERTKYRSIVAIPENAAKNHLKILRARAEFERTGKRFTDKMLVKKTSISPQKIQECVRATSAPVYIDEARRGDNRREFDNHNVNENDVNSQALNIENIGDPVFEDLSQTSSRNCVVSILEKLYGEFNAKIIALRFGLTGEDMLTLEATAYVLKVSSEKTRLNQQSVIADLRERLARGCDDAKTIIDCLKGSI